MADIDNKEQSELDQDLDDVEEEEETDEETKIKAVSADCSDDAKSSDSCSPSRKT